MFGGINDRPEGIAVNGVVITDNMHFPITGSFSVYQNSSIVVPLNAGVNEVVMFNVTDHGVSRVDTMTVTQGGSATPTATVPNPTPTPTTATSTPTPTATPSASAVHTHSGGPASS